MNSILLAAYGTLRKGGMYSHYLADERYLGTERVCGFLMFVSPDGDWPYLIDGEGSITLEVYAIRPSTLERCDELEEYPEHYVRRLIETSHGPAWIYLVNPEDEIYPRLLSSDPISSGDWMDR